MAPTLRGAVVTLALTLAAITASLTGACGRPAAPPPAASEPQAAPGEPTAPSLPVTSATATPPSSAATAASTASIAPPVERPPPPPAEAVERVRIALANATRAMASTRSVLVIDLASGAVLFEEGADRSLVPASNTKLFTTGAALDRLGDEHRVSTRLQGRGHLEDGTWHGTITLAGTGDFTWATRHPDDPGAALDELVAQLEAAGVKRIAGGLRVEGPFFVEGARAGEYDEEAQRRAARGRLRRALAARKIKVTTSPSPEEPSDARTLAEIFSGALIDEIVPINVHSHNAFAELLQRHLALEAGQPPTVEGGARAMAVWVATLGLSPEGAAGTRLVDGSGLSRDDHASARSLAVVLTKMAAEHPRFVASLSVAGTTGTLGRRLLGDDTRGRVHAKTGTLADVTALSGFVDNRHDGRRYLFALLQNGARDIAAARRAEDTFVERVASGWNAPAPAAR